MYHDCNFCNGKGKLATLSFKRDQLLYDIKNCSWIEGDVLQTDDPHATHQIQDIGEAGNIDRVTRILDLAHAEVVDILFSYCRQNFPHLTPPSEDTTLPQSDIEQDDTLSETDTYTIPMNVPENFSKTTVVLLEKLIHEYMICRVLEDWMSITNPGAQGNWDSKKKEIKLKIGECMNARIGRARRKLSPF